MIINPQDIEQKDRYKLLISTILPRPIAWVSTQNRAGALNLAPYSFFTVATVSPMTLLFCPQIPAQTGQKKDTLRNIEEVPEFVINIANEDLAQEMNRTASGLPYGMSEFEWAGVTPAPSEVIQVPRVAEAPVSYECTLQRIVVVNEQAGGGAVVFGEVQRIHLREDIYQDSYIDLDQFKAIGRMTGAGYVRATDRFDLPRIPYTG